MESKNEYAARVGQLAVLLGQLHASGRLVSPEREAARALDLIKLARQHHSICEWECNVALDGADERRRQRRKQRTEEKIATLLREADGRLRPRVSVDFAGDPRGYTVKIHFPKVDGRTPYNTWGGEESGWGI